MATVQLNARIDAELKASGDAALALIGLSPTQAVRALWRKASIRGKDLEEVANLLVPTSQKKLAVVEEPIESDVVRQGWAFMEGAYASLGIDSSTSRSYSDEDLLEAALLERDAQKGLS